MTKLKIGRGLQLPEDAVTQTFAILAKRGVGKTYTASVMTEELLKAHLPVVAIDPIGVWWGLRHSADGKSEGLPIVVFGGEHGDAPLEKGAGEVLADLVVDERFSCVLDLSSFRKGEQIRFMTDFAERLYRRNREPLHLMLDEADSFAPQRTMRGEGAERLLGAIEDLVRRGRARGLGMTLVTQRPAVLNKNVLTQIETLVAMRTVSPQDRSAIDDWVKVYGEPGQREEVMESLASLDIGESWWWSPGWLELLKRVHVRQRETFDSSSTPKSGERRVQPKRAADVDLDAVREKIAATIERAKATDPKELQRRVRELEKQLRDQPTPVPEKVEVPVLEPDQVQELGQLVDQIGDMAVNLTQAARDIAGELARLNGNGAHPSAAAQDVAQRPVRRPAPERPSQRRQEPAAELSGDVELKAGARRMLETLVRISPVRVSKAQLATLVGMKVTGGTYQTYFSKLRREGLIVEGGDRLLEPTDAGFDYLGDTRPAPLTQEEVVETWRRSLKRGARRMLDVLLEQHPGWVSKDDLGERLGMEPSGGTFNTYVSTLRRNGLAEVYGSEVRASDTLFEVVGV